MAIPYTDNNGSTFYNINECKSFNQSISSSLVSLSSQPCSEVIVINKTGRSVYLYDNNNFNNENSLLLADGESIAIRGVTNSAQVSAKTDTGFGTLYYRTQYFSILPQR